MPVEGESPGSGMLQNEEKTGIDDESRTRSSRATPEEAL